MARQLSYGFGEIPLTSEQWEMVWENRGLLFHMANVLLQTRCSSEAEREEAIWNLGFPALVRSVKAFKPELGFKFATYACRAIAKAYIHMGSRRKNALLHMHPYLPLDSDSCRTIVDSKEERRREKDEAVDKAEFLLGSLEEKEEELIRLRFFSKWTLAKLGKYYNVHQECIRQRIIKILVRLREAA